MKRRRWHYFSLALNCWLRIKPVGGIGIRKWAYFLEMSGFRVELRHVRRNPL